MKNLTKLFVAVAVLFAGFACTTDATEDLGVNVGGQSTLCLSLEESRTELGEKAEDVYPLKWSEGDQIAVNGAVSSALTAEQAGGAGAEFAFDAVLTRPLSIIYPASAEAGMVTFLGNQEYKVGTFAPGAAPMYGYATEVAEGEEATPIQMKHLTGVLRFAVKGEVSLASAVITSDNGDLAGTYAVDCATGALTAQEGLTSKQITLSFGEGLALNTAEATPFYVTVPAGQYGAMQVRLITTDGKNMVVKFSSYGDKAIKAGTVREFGEFDFVENAISADEAGVFEIYTYEDLQKFAKIAAVFSPRSEAKLMANINIPEGVQWTPIEGYTHTFNGNNFTIDGLTAPLFGHSEAKIRDLTLTNVSISGQDDELFGVFARVIDNGALVNCSAEGTLTYGDSLLGSSCVGALVGKTSNSEFKNNTNRVNIVANGTVTEISESILRLGGLAGALYSPVGKVEKCYNYGNIVVNGKVDRVFAAGLFSFCGSTAELVDCHNEGEIHLPTNIQSKSHSIVGGLVSGIENEKVNGSVFKVSGCSNKGNIIFGDKGGESVTPTTGESVYYVHLCGLVGYTRGLSANALYSVEIKDSNNYGNVEVNAVNVASVVKLSGIMSQLSADATISNCHNHGKLAVYSGAKHQIFFGGGICHIISEVGGSTVKIDNCSNNGEIYASDKISHGNTPYYGGFTAYINNSAACSYNKVYNHGKITFKSFATGNNMIYTGGLIGYLDAAAGVISMTDCGNTGELNYLHSLSQDRKNMYMGGVIGHNGAVQNGVFKNITNTGNITATGSTNRFILAGLVGSTAKDLTFENCSNSGNITVENTQSFNGEHAWVAGLTGVILNTSGDISITLNNCENSGDILVQNTTYTGQLAVGGVSSQMIYNSSHAYCGKMYMNDCSNTGNITVKDVAVAKDFSVGGILSSISKNGYAEIKAPVQNGNITVSIPSDKNVIHTAIGGIIGNMESGKIIKNDSGKRGSVAGKIAVTSHSEDAGQWHAISAIAGFVTESAAEISDVDVLATNDSALTLNMTNAASNTYVAGFAGYINVPVTLKNLVNSAAVNYKVNGQSTSNCQPFVGGGCGRTLAAVTMDNCTNNGDITVEGTKMTVELDCGGLLACNHTAHGIFSNLTNNGDILIKKGDGTCGILYIAGIAGGQLVACTATNHFTNCTNNGDITLEEGLSTTGKAGNIRLGGCFAWTKQSYDENIRNNGNINIHAKTTGSNTQLLIGGVYGYNAAAANSDMDGGYVNTGTITITGGSGTSTNAFGVAAGGIVGAFYGAISNAVNLGDIKFTGSANSANSTVGGIVGYSTAAGKITNCKHYGNIQAIDMAKGTMYPNVGAITGSHRVQVLGTTARTAIVENCQLGGAILGEYDTEDEEYKTITLDASNYFNYIYGSGEGTDWTGTDNYDGCTLLTAKPSVE